MYSHATDFVVLVLLCCLTMGKRTVNQQANNVYNTGIDNLGAHYNRNTIPFLEAIKRLLFVTPTIVYANAGRYLKQEWQVILKRMTQKFS
jgi:hypothetical protein